jgi:tetraacyldisaccharide 4'-kinase
MDDGFQNPSLEKDLSLLVVDGSYGFGNGRVMPAGPLRESIAAALARADAVVVMGADEAGVAAQLGGARVLTAQLAPCGAVAAGQFFAFAGIGRPEKFFRTLAALGVAVVAQRGFPDHHPYGETELATLAADAAAARARLITTAKDAVRLPPPWRAQVAVLEIAVAWQDEAALDRLLAPLVAPGRRIG